MKSEEQRLAKPSLIREAFRLPKLSYRVWRVWRRDYDVFVKTFKINFFPPLLEPIFYLAALGYGFGALIPQIEGVSYAQFLAPALISISIMYGSFFECTYGSFVRMYFQRTFDAIIATPVSIEEVIAGEVLWGGTRSLIGGSIVLGVVTAFGLVRSPLVLLIPFVAFLAGLLFAALAMCFTALAGSIDFFNYPAYLLIAPMFVMSGTFFPLSQFPVLIQDFAIAVLPLTHTVNLTRAFVLGTPDVSLIYSVIWIAGVAALFFVLSINLMKRKLLN